MKDLIFLHPLLWEISFTVWMIFLYFYFSTKKSAKKFKFMADIEAVFWKSQSYFFVNLSILFLLIVVLSLIIADPNQKQTKTKVIKNGIDIALVLDLSYSMVAEDIAPNRLEVAKKVLSDFTSKLQTDRVWLILFSGKPFTSVPLTFDYDFITQYVKNISIKNINQDFLHLQWTAIWDALLYWAHLFDDNSNREKVIVLFTDGEANKWINPLEVIRYITAKKIKVHTVGIGGDKDTYVIIKNMYGSQKKAIWWVDETNLRTLASLTQWQYYRANNEETFSQIFQKLNLLQKKEIVVEQVELLKNNYTPFVMCAFFLFFVFISYNFYYY